MRDGHNYVCYNYVRYNYVRYNYVRYNYVRCLRALGLQWSQV